MPDTPTPHELARDMSQLHQQFGSALKEMKDDIGQIRKDTSAILAEQARARQEGIDHERRIGRLEEDQVMNRRLVVGSLLFPIMVVLVGALLTFGVGA